MQETQAMGVQALGQEDFLEKEKTTHSSILAWKIHGQRSLAGYSVWVHRESDMTEPLNSVLTALKIHFRVYCKKSRTGGSEAFPLPSHNHPILTLLPSGSTHSKTLDNKRTNPQFSHSVVFDSLWPHESQHARLPCPSPNPRVYSNSSPSSRWCHPAISTSVVPFSFCPQSLPTSGSSPMSQLFTRGGQSTGVSPSASVLPMNTQDWSRLGWTDWISLQFKGLSRVFSNTTVQKHQFFGTQLSSQSNSHIHTWPLEKP